MSNFRKESRKVQAQIVKVLLAEEGYIATTSSSDIDCFEGGDFRYIPGDGKLIGGITCGGLIDNYEELETFFRERGLFLYNIADSYGIPTESGNQGATGAINTLQVNEYLIGGAALPDSIHSELKNKGVKFNLSPVSEFWKTGGGIHCLTNQL